MSNTFRKTNDNFKLTPAQLKHILFNIENQDMTVSELRSKLTNMKDEDYEKSLNNENDFLKLFTKYDI